LHLSIHLEEVVPRHARFNEVIDGAKKITEVIEIGLLVDRKYYWIDRKLGRAVLGDIRVCIYIIHSVCTGTTTLGR